MLCIVLVTVFKSNKGHYIPAFVGPAVEGVDVESSWSEVKYFCCRTRWPLGVGMSFTAVVVPVLHARWLMALLARAGWRREASLACTEQAAPAADVLAHGVPQEGEDDGMDSACGQLWTIQ